MKRRAVGFIDGFNLYHAIADLRQPHLKWLNLWELCRQFAPASHFDLNAVCYFSAYATWRPNAYRRHRTYVAALEAVGVTPVLAKFKEKHRGCRKCGARWIAHEEKETDVNLAIELLERAGNEYDRALLITGDSDISPAVRRLRKKHPDCEVKVLSPIRRKPSYELLHAAGKKPGSTKLNLMHLERSLLPEQLVGRNGKTIARPPEYAPPRA